MSNKYLVPALILASCALGGCTPAADAPAAAVPAIALGVPVPIGALAVDLPHLRRQLGGHRSLLDVDLAEVTHLKVRITGPGIATPIVTEPSAIDDTMATIAVPAGANRVVTVEGLNVDGVPVVRRMAVTSIAATGVTEVALDPMTTVVGRFFEALAASPTAGAMAATDEGLVGKVRAFADGVIAFDAEANTYAGRVPPDNFRAKALEAAWEDDPTVLDRMPAAEFGKPSLTTVNVKLPASFDGDVEVLLADPAPVQVASDTERRIRFVPPGPWAVYVLPAGGARRHQLVEVEEGAATTDVVFAAL